jgi:general stress protein YciG
VIREYMREIGKRGGSVKGPAKRRGDKDYYSRIAKMRKAKPKPEAV